MLKKKKHKTSRDENYNVWGENTPDEINCRVAITDKKLSEFEDIVVEFIQIWSIKRKKTELNEASIRDS